MDDLLLAALRQWASPDRKSKLVRKFGKSAGHRFGGHQNLSFQNIPVREGDICVFDFGDCRARLRGDWNLQGLTFTGYRKMNLVGLENAAAIGLVHGALAKADQSRPLVAESLEEGYGNSFRSTSWRAGIR